MTDRSPSPFFTLPACLLKHLFFVCTDVFMSVSSLSARFLLSLTFFLYNSLLIDTPLLLALTFFRLSVFVPSAAFLTHSYGSCWLSRQRTIHIYSLNNVSLSLNDCIILHVIKENETCHEFTN